jgi:hypothetical protein
MDAHRGRARRAWVSAVVILSAGVGAVVVSIATGASPSPSPSPSPIPEGCQLQSPQPEAPLKLNAVPRKDLVKVVVMEKETFNCYDARSTLAQIKDVETFVEVVEQSDGGKNAGMTTVRMAVEAATCIKDLKTGKVSCKSESIPLAVTDTPLLRCTPTRSTYPFAVIQQPSHPVEMETVVSDDKLVTTIKVEKEIYDCSGQLGDLYVFTERVELADGKTFKTVQRRFSGVICFKDETAAKITSCKLFTPGNAP